MLKLLHTADIHLGAPFRNLGDKGKDIRRALRETFSSLLQLAADERADLVLIAGDLFDSNDVSSDLVDFVTSEFRKARIPVCILPGTHDCLVKNSIYRDARFQGIPNMHIFTDEKASSKVYPELDLTVHARANLSNQSRVSPLEGIRPNPATRFNVVMAHGSIRIESKSAPDDYPVALEEINASGMNYVALGHWHTPQDFSRGNTTAWYCGTPENLGFDGRSPVGQALLVILDNGGNDGVKVEPRQTGRYTWKEISLDASELADEAALAGRLMPHAGTRSLLKVKLTGLAHLDFIPDEERIREMLSEYFYHVVVDTRSVHLMESEIDPAAYPANTVTGRFLRLMRDKIQAAPDEGKQEYEEALQVGLALLKGRKIL